MRVKGKRRKSKRQPSGCREKSYSGKSGLLFFFVRRSRRDRWRRRRSCIRFVAHSLLEFLDARPQAAHQFRDPAPAEQNHHNDQDQQQMHRAKFHKASLQHPFRSGHPHLPFLRQSYLVQSITRSLPTRRVNRSRSRYSSKGIAYFRVTWVSSLNAAIGNRSPFFFLYEVRSALRCSTALL